MTGLIAPLAGQTVYASFEYGDTTPQTGGSGTFGMTNGMPDFDFSIDDPNDHFILSGIRDNEKLDDLKWQANFGALPPTGFDNFFVQIKGPAQNGNQATSITVNFDFTAGGGTPAGVNWGIAVIDLEVEDAIFSAVDATGGTVPQAVVAGWFQNVFDGDHSAAGGLETSFAQWDAASAALVAESDSDGLLDNGLVDAISTESASGWIKPDIPLNSISIEYRNRTNSTAGIPNPGAANAHFVLAVVPEPQSASLFGLACILMLSARRRSLN